MQLEASAGIVIRIHEVVHPTDKSFRAEVNQNRLSLRSGSGNRSLTNLSFAVKQISAELSLVI